MADRLAAFLAGRRAAFLELFLAAFRAPFRAPFFAVFLALFFLALFFTDRLAAFLAERLAAFLAGRLVVFWADVRAGRAAEGRLTEAGLAGSGDELAADDGVVAGAGGGSLGRGSIHPEPDQPISI